MQKFLENIYKQNQEILKQISEIKLQQEILKSEVDKINSMRDVSLSDFMKTLSKKSTASYIIEKMPKVSVFDNAFELLTFSLNKVQKEGLYIEFGVYKGTTINHISSIAKNTIVYGFDSFEGLPEAWRSGFHKGHFKLRELPKVNSNVKLVKGLFEDSLPDFLQEHKEDCAFLHIDCDLYSSTATIFKQLKPRIKTGTIIVFDEYFNYPSWEIGEFKAFQEFIKDCDYDYRYIGYNRNHQQCAVRIVDKQK